MKWAGDKLIARIAELEAENLRWQAESLKNLIRAGEAEAALAELDRMLKEAYDDYVCGRLDGDPPFMEAPEWLDDLRTRVEERSE